MHLLFVASFTGMGGAERSLIPLAKVLHRAGYDLSLLLVKPPKDDRIFRDFPGTVAMPSNSTFMGKLQALVQLNKMSANADILIATSEHTVTYVSWLISLWHRKPLAADVQVCLSRRVYDDKISPIHDYLCRWIYPRIFYIRCVAEGVTQDMRSHYKVPTKNLHTIYVPFDLDAIAQAGQLPILDNLSHIFSRPTIVAVGRLTKQKRFDIAIQSFFHLHQNYNIDANLLILGDGELRPQLEQQVQSLNLQERVFLPGFVENPHAYIKRSQVFLLSSDYEGLPRVLIEALALACPVVATDCPSGPNEILEGGKWGLLTPVANPEAIADALAQVLQNSELAQKLSHASLQRAKAFDTQAITQQYETFLNQALSHQIA